MSGVNPGSAVLDVSKIRAEEGQGCPRCGGKVFMAEEINARGRVSVLSLLLMMVMIVLLRGWGHG